jgi:putative oxygen-independent coproporphyrinogen III oxidase
LSRLPQPQAGRVHLYLHIPYCASKCPYCDFNSVAGRDHEHQRYVAALLREVQRLPIGPYRTIFIGGGTPTMLSAGLLARLLAGVRQHVQLAEGYEWTCEANPGSVDADRFRVLAEHGVNRISIGVQSTNGERLRFLGRVHTGAEAEAALSLATGIFPRVSADLIMGLPGQDEAELAKDLELYRRHNLGHASVYHLTYEPGTEFHARRARGELADIEVERSRRLFEVVWDGLAALGLAAYETSNFARSGQASQHNLAYWQGSDYQAAGAGAVSTVAGLRVTREKHSGRYIDAIQAGGDAQWRVESIGERERLVEAWMLGLRLTSGVAVERLLSLGDRAERWRPRVDELSAQGLVNERDGHVMVTRAGRAVQDEVTVALLPE